MSAPQEAIRTIAIASGKGGVGKSFFALNLALALSELGQRSVLVELDADAGALSISAGLGESKVRAPATGPNDLADRTASLGASSRVQLLRAADIPPQIARSPNTLGPWLQSIQAKWRIVDLAPGIGAQNILWMRAAQPPILIGTPELVCVQAMLRLNLQLRRQHAYERLCVLEPRLRSGPASLAAARSRLIEWHGESETEQLWTKSFVGFRASWWIFNRVLPDDAAQLARIAQYLHRHAGPAAARLRTIPEDAAQVRCARFGRPLLSTDSGSSAAGAIRRIADELLAFDAKRGAVAAA